MKAVVWIETNNPGKSVLESHFQECWPYITRARLGV